MKDKKYFDEKFVFYKNLQFYTIVIACLSNVMYLSSDFDIYGGFSIKILICRLIPMVFLPLYVSLFQFSNKTPHFKQFASFFMFHIQHLTTIASCYFLAQTNHVCEGNMVFMIVIFILGICSSLNYALISMSLFWACFLLSGFFIQYEELSVVIVNMLPVAVGTMILLIPLNNTYKKQYEYRKQINFLAYHDWLTRLYSRNALQLFCYENTTILTRQNVSIAIIDIDNFKKINDAKGHSYGDKCLELLADIIRSCLLKNDFAMRWGGEEFVLVINSSNNPVKIIENIREQIQLQTDFTISIGLTHYTGKELETDVMKAGEALLYAKKHGKNKTVEYEKIHDAKTKDQRY
ncbi:MAG: GGDEF domain-containing protein [Spirochaetaceae bacterium]|nr:GGDEF domain-containing protein [Spirochaetaceae bacterium]